MSKCKCRAKKAQSSNRAKATSGSNEESMSK